MNNHKDKVSVKALIKAKTGFDVLPLKNSTRQSLVPYIEQAIKTYNSGTIFPGRVNEFGNYMEDVLRQTNPSIFCKPTKTNGRKQGVGYPDLEVYPAYIEVKILQEGSEDGDMRSFYVSSFDKITRDAEHVLIGFEHNHKVLTGRYHIQDLGNIVLQLKMEYQCGNKTLYESCFTGNLIL